MAVVGSLTLVSRITGLARDVSIAAAFGAGHSTDAFWLAFRIPNLMRRLFAEGAFTQAFLPVLSALKMSGSDTELRSFLNHVVTLLICVLLPVVLLGIIGSPFLVTAVASGLRDASRTTEFGATIWMSRVMLPYIFFMALIAFSSGILNVFGRFAIPAITPVFLNICIIISCFWLAPHYDPPIYALAIGVVIGGILQLLFQWSVLFCLGLSPCPTFKVCFILSNPNVKRALHKIFPAILGVSITQVSVLINSNIATWLPFGSITWLSFADRLMEFPIAILGTALSTVLLPNFTRTHAKNDQIAYSALLDWGLSLTLLLGLPASLSIALLSEGLIATLFHHGAFLTRDVAETRIAVVAYTLGFIGLLAMKVLVPAFYARQDTCTPMKVAILALVLTQLLNGIFVPIFAHAGLALTISLGASINALCLLVILIRRKIYKTSLGWRVFLLRMSPALLTLSTALFYANQYVSWLDVQKDLQSRVFYLLGITISGAFLYFGILWMSGFRPKDFYHTRIG